MGSFDGSKFHHGGPFRLAVLDGALDPERTIQIGIRGAANVFWEFSYASGMTVIEIEEFTALGVAAVAQRARDVVGDGPVYVSVDVDGFDPAYAPGTGTPEVGGLTPREGLALLRALTGLNICGGDVVEVAPQYDPTTNTAQLAAQLLFEELALMAASPGCEETLNDPSCHRPLRFLSLCAFGAAAHAAATPADSTPPPQRLVHRFLRVEISPNASVRRLRGGRFARRRILSARSRSHHPAHRRRLHGPRGAAMRPCAAVLAGLADLESRRQPAQLHLAHAGQSCPLGVCSCTRRRRAS